MASARFSEKVFVDINGLRQGMFIQGTSDRNPVLLWLHGGMPDTFLAAKYPTGLEELFTVIWWERRGTGISAHLEMARTPVTVDQLVSDTLSVTAYLRERFEQDKIYLLGHSEGSFIGIQAAVRAPEMYRSYIGIAQMTNQLASEKLAYDYMLEEFRRRGDGAMVRKLESAPVTLDEGTPRGYLLVRDIAMHRLGIGTMHDMRSIVTGLMLPSVTFRGYTLREKVNLWRAKARSGVSKVWPQILAKDIAIVAPELRVPAFFLHGVYDYTVSYKLARSYVAKLEAPVKGFYTFHHSAHCPMFEEPARTRRILAEDVLGGANAIADLDVPAMVAHS